MSTFVRSIRIASQRTSLPLCTPGRTAIAIARPFSSSSATRSGSAGASPKHTTDTYAKEDATTHDDTPATETVHRVDPSSTATDPPPAEWGRSGEYELVDKENKEQPYSAPGEEARYGSKERYDREKGGEMPSEGEGPAAGDKGGRK